MFFIYNILIYPILPLIKLRLKKRGKKNPAYNERWDERFAKYTIPPLNSCFWIHAVSLGEAISATPLIKALMQKFPNEKIVATTMTPTGSQKLRETFGNAIIQIYVPYDYPYLVKRFLRHFNPRLFIIMETELWPNILHITSKRNIPILLANARISERAFERYKYIKPLCRKMLNNITLVLAQSADEGIRFLKLGLEQKRLNITGNIKFDIAIPSSVHDEADKMLTNWRLSSKRQIWIAASTHRGEEEIILAAAKTILSQLPKVLLILVPRHPERFDEVFELCQKEGLNTLRYSRNPIVTGQTQVIVGDTIGKLLQLYSLAQVAFVGGSLVEIGGHNLLEPAALGVPILTGPHLTNFQEISKLLFANRAAIKVENSNEVAENVMKLFTDDELHTNMSRAASEVVAQNRGALQQILRLAEDRL